MGGFEGWHRFWTLGLVLSLGVWMGCGRSSLDYLGQDLPGLESVRFSPNFVSLPGSMEYAGVFSPDMKAFYFSHRDSRREDQRIWVTKKTDPGWSLPGPAPFAADAMSYEPCFHPSGNRLYFGSQRSFPGKPDSDRLTFFWQMERTDRGWSTPTPIDTTVGNALPTYISVALDGSIYFGSYRAPGIFVSRCVDGQYQPPQPLPKVINDLPGAGHPYIAPDQSFLIFDAQGGPGHQGAFDLYISYRDGSGAWSAPRNLGPRVNGPAAELSASLTPDGRFLIFNRSTYTESDLYWVRAEVDLQQ